MKAYCNYHYEMISKWCSLRDKPAPPEWAVPDSGLIIEGVACGFVILLSNGCGMLDFYISNPHADRESRRKALREITSELIEVAKELGVKMLLCNTQSESIKNLAFETGFRLDGDFTCFSMEI